MLLQLLNNQQHLIPENLIILQPGWNLLRKDLQRQKVRVLLVLVH